MNEVRRGPDAAVEALRSGRPVIVVDGRGSGELVLAAEYAPSESIAFLVRHTSGYLCVAAPEQRWEQLGVPRMPGCDNQRGVAYGVAVDAREGVTTGISARERAHTIRLLADPLTRPEDLIRPGHVVTERVRPGGLLERGGIAEATVDLARFAGLHPVGVRGHVVADDGFTAGDADLRALAREHDLVLVTIDELVTYHARRSATVTRAASITMPTEHGEFIVRGYRDELDGSEYLALARVAAAGAGVVVYLRGHAGRGTGLVDQLRAPALQDEGDHMNGADAVPRLVDAGEYRAAAHVLRDLGIERVRLLTGSQAMVAGLEQCGVTVHERVDPIAGQCAAALANGLHRLAGMVSVRGCA